MELGAQVAKLVWKKVLATRSPKDATKSKRPPCFVRGCLAMVEVMSAHHANRGVPTVAKLSVELTQHHYLVNREHGFQVTKQKQMKGVLDGSIRYIYGRIGHCDRHMLASNRLEMN